jgi:uncharacterized protein (TIGR03083 family)
VLDQQTYLDAVTAETDTLLLSASLALTEDVLTCPGWTVEKLVRHVAGLHAWVAALVERRPAVVPHTDLPIPPKGHELFPFAEAALVSVVDALRAADPDAPVHSWAGEVTAAWWARRLAHETAMHRADAQLSTGDGPPSPIETALAIDGLDETLALFTPGRFSREAFGAGDGTVHLHATDGDGEWFLRLGDTIEVTREHAKGDTAARGTASDLLYVLWRRQPPETIEVLGDRDLFARFLQCAT